MCRQISRKLLTESALRHGRSSSRLRGPKEERRSIKKGLLTRCVNRLRAVVGQGADVQADTVDESRRRARLLLQELDNINVQMETVLLENDIAREDDEEGVSRPTARFIDVESNFEEVTAREIQPPRAIARSAVHHVQRLIEDDIKKLFYSDVAGVKPTTACICSDKELAEAKFLQPGQLHPSHRKEESEFSCLGVMGTQRLYHSTRRRQLPECISRRTP